MLVTENFLKTISAIFLLLGKARGCRPKCEGEEGISTSLRPFFTDCLTKKLAGVGVDWKALVDYVVWDDSWYYTTESFFCKGKNEECWLENLQYLIKPKSYKYPYVRHCIAEYMAPQDPPVSCEVSESPVYRPMIHQKFEAMLGCPRSDQRFVQCLKNTAFLQTSLIIIRKEQQLIKPSYKMGQLIKFIRKHRSDCRITAVGSSYLRSCTDTAGNNPSNKTTESLRVKRSGNSLKDIIAQSGGGRINFRLTGTGTVRVLPSKPIKIKASNAPKCLSKKLQMVMKSRTVLSNVVSKCNAEANKQRTTQVSTVFRVQVPEKKLPGQVGKCKNENWSDWANIDSPSKGTGDLEYLNRIRRRNRGSKRLCIRPSAVQAVVAKTGIGYKETRDNVKISPTFGLSCHNYKQTKPNKKCQDYKVRFCCDKP